MSYQNSDLLNFSTLLSYHKYAHNALKFCLSSLCLIFCNHHLTCPFSLLGTDLPRLLVADIGFRTEIGLSYLNLSCQLVCVGIISNNCVKFPHNRLVGYRRSENVDCTSESYLKWHDMIHRCYIEKSQKRQPQYMRCIVCEKWLNYSNFKV